MKIGILTFHHQLNYGGVLQAFALRRLLMGHGYEVAFAKSGMDCVRVGWLRRAEARIKWLARVLLRGEDFGSTIRRKRTERFIAENLPEADLTVCPPSALIVGSDQVWNTRILREKVTQYLPAKSSDEQRLVAYAVSLGMTEIAAADARAFQEGLPRFDAVSVRERASVSLLAPFYQGGIVHVCDPTLHLSAEDWAEALGLPACAGETRRVFVYALDLKPKFLRDLMRYAVRNRVFVDVYGDPWLTTMPRTPMAFLKLKGLQMRMLFSRVRVVRSAGPREFVQAIRSARCVLADSFHALMFATIFKKPVRIIVDRVNAHRVKMGARVVEFAERYWSEGAICSGWREALDDNAFSTVLDGSDLMRFIDDSKRWLLRNLQTPQGRRI